MTDEIPQSTIVSSDIEFVWITEPAKTGSIAHENIVDELLWNFPPNNSKSYYNKRFSWNRSIFYFKILKIILCQLGLQTHRMWDIVG